MELLSLDGLKLIGILVGAASLGIVVWLTIKLALNTARAQGVAEERAARSAATQEAGKAAANAMAQNVSAEQTEDRLSNGSF